MKWGYQCFYFVWLWIEWVNLYEHLERTLKCFKHSLLGYVPPPVLYFFPGTKKFCIRLLLPPLGQINHFSVYDILLCIFSIGAETGWKLSNPKKKKKKNPFSKVSLPPNYRPVFLPSGPNVRNFFVITKGKGRWSCGHFLCPPQFGNWGTENLIF